MTDAGAGLLTDEQGAVRVRGGWWDMDEGKEPRPDPNLASYNRYLVTVLYSPAMKCVENTIYLPTSLQTVNTVPLPSRKRNTAKRESVVTQ